MLKTPNARKIFVYTSIFSLFFIYNTHSPPTPMPFFTMTLALTWPTYQYNVTSWDVHIRGDRFLTPEKIGSEILINQSVQSEHSN